MEDCVESFSAVRFLRDSSCVSILRASIRTWVNENNTDQWWDLADDSNQLEAARETLPKGLSQQQPKWFVSTIISEMFLFPTWSVKIDLILAATNLVRDLFRLTLGLLR